MPLDVNSSPLGHDDHWRVVAREGDSFVFLEPADIWAFEATHRLAFVHTRSGRFDVDLTLAALEASFDGRLLRVHRNWLVRPAAVRRMTRNSGELLLHLGEEVGAEKLCIPVSRENAGRVRQVLLRDARGVRRS